MGALSLPFCGVFAKWGTEVDPWYPWRCTPPYSVSDVVVIGGPFGEAANFTHARERDSEGEVLYCEELRVAMRESVLRGRLCMCVERRGSVASVISRVNSAAVCCALQVVVGRSTEDRHSK